MKSILLLYISLLTFLGGRSQIYQTTQGTISFAGKAKMGNIDAVSKQVSAFYHSSRSLAFKVQVSSFEFSGPQLMKMKFNKMMRSDIFPHASFTGKIQQHDYDFTKAGTYNVTVTGKLQINGYDKNITVPGTVEVSGNTLHLKAKFNVFLEDYKITVDPGISELKQIEISVDCKLNSGKS